MLIWLLLFLTIVLVSFVLALRSMSDYYEKPAKTAGDYAPFLIRKPAALTAAVLDELHQSAQEDRLLLSFERLFKGGRQALVIYGSKSNLQPFSDTLGLLELEDYSLRVDHKNLNASVKAWELGIKKPGPTTGQPRPDNWLDDGEEYWWEMVVQPSGLIEETTKQVFTVLVGKNSGNPNRLDSLKEAAKDKLSAEKGGEKRFQLAMRAVLVASDKKRSDMLQSSLTKIGSQVGIIPLPQPFAVDQLVKLYQERALPQFGEDGMPVGVTSKQLEVLLTLPVR